MLNGQTFLYESLASVWFDDDISGATTYALADGDPDIDIMAAQARKLTEK